MGPSKGEGKPTRTEVIAFDSTQATLIFRFVCFKRTLPCPCFAAVRGAFPAVEARLVRCMLQNRV